MSRLATPVLARGRVHGSVVTLAALAVSATFVACGVADPAIKGAGCTSDADCDGSMRCFAARFCIQTSLHDWDVVMRVSPGPTSGFVEEHFETSVGGPMPEANTWQLTRPARVRGTVRLPPKGAGLSELIPGTLIATTPGKLAAASLRYTTSSKQIAQSIGPTPQDAGGNGERADGVGGWGFELRVQPGQTYDVSFWPQSKEIPPHYERRTIGGDVDNLAIQLPVTPDVITVRGRIISRKQAPLCDPVYGPQAVTECDVDCSALPQLQVALVDTLGRQRSTQGKTGSDGRFVIRASALAGPLYLRFDATGDLPAADAALSADDQLSLSLPSGTWKTPIDTAALRKFGTIDHDMGDIDLGPLDTHHKLVREVLGDNGLPLAGATVRVQRPVVSPLRCDLDDTGGWHTVPAIRDFVVRRSEISDSAGLVRMRMLAGKGKISVIPPAHVSSGAWISEEVDLSPTAEAIRCASRRKVRGSVEFRDRPINGVTIHIQPLPALDGQKAASDPALAPIFVSSNDDGRYAVFLDPGRYAMIIEPPFDSGLARTVSNILEVKAPTKADAAPVEHNIAAWPPTVLHGRLLGANGAPEPGVLVDVLGKQLQLLEGLAIPASSEQARAQNTMVLLQTHRLGSAVTDSDGRFEMLIAPGNLSN